KIILASALSLLLVACGEDAAKEGKEASKAVVEEATQVVEKATGAVEEKTVADDATDAMKKKAAVAEAKAIIMAFGSALKAELKTAMKAGGPKQALDVCHLAAGPIAGKVAKEKGAQISRVSLKNRNPANVPNDWQKAVLEDFDARAAKGEDIKTMGFAEVVENEGKKHLRFMKALPVGDGCLKCHGTAINDDVQEKITALYPNDKATGYEKGQVRGAVVIVKEMK
ncbi:MAG TPA: DUF3365 domain-containing protein, partial [Thiotrichaceae bacterium]|nr:DUF3365 domain-containing protein [Thiotrichaceae bacterium]